MLEVTTQLGERELAAVRRLEEVVVAHDDGRLKLEPGVLASGPVEAALWWADELLLGFAALYDFGPTDVEIAGMVAPRSAHQVADLGALPAGVRQVHPGARPGEHVYERVRSALPGSVRVGQLLLACQGLQHGDQVRDELAQRVGVHLTRHLHQLGLAVPTTLLCFQAMLTGWVVHRQLRGLSVVSPSGSRR